jgi:glycosyltransferase involved in cell wall biosynthesis
MYPEVSVVIPTYNTARFIADAIDSALAQSYKPSEIIVIDDGSSDNTREVITHYGDKIKYIYQSNAGPASARNKGVKEARGEWIAFLDSDDYWDKDHLELLLKHAQDHPDASLIYCGKKWVDMDGKLIQDSFEQTQFPSGWIFKDMFTANYISSTSVVLVKKGIFIELGGFDKQLRIAEDYDLWIRIAAVSPICGVPIYTLNYRRHENNLTLQTVEQYKADLIVLEKAQKMIRSQMVDRQNNPEIIDIRMRMKQFYMDIVLFMFSISEFKELRSFGLDALKHRYISIPLLMRWLLSWLPEKTLLSMKKIYQRFRIHNGG